MKTTIPAVHTSPETACLILDYPYGFRLRCQMRVWVEHRPKMGYRVVTQTSNPKRGDTWNAPKTGNYARAIALYLDENGHVQNESLTPWAEKEKVESFKAEFEGGVYGN